MRKIPSSSAKAERYLQYYQTDLGRVILKQEADYLRNWLKDCGKILDVGCGPGVFEKELGELNIVGVDNNPQMVELARKQASNRFEVADAQKLPFYDDEFDAVFYVTSLEFICDYKKALDEAMRILNSQGKIILMLCHQESDYFQQKVREGKHSVQNIFYHNFNDMEAYLSNRFSIHSEYMLGIKDERIFNTNDQSLASIYCITGTPK